jgi:MOSC domain-containing protein YiiM
LRFSTDAMASLFEARLPDRLGLCDQTYQGFVIVGTSPDELRALTGALGQRDEGASRHARGRLIGIARKIRHRAPMQELSECQVFAGGGLEGDYSGKKYPARGVTVLAREAWEAALTALGRPDAEALPWLVRRANLLVEGVVLPRARGGVVRIGPVLLEVTAPTVPCSRMEAACPGLLKALYPDWRGGICCRVVEGGSLGIGEPVEVLVSPPEKNIRLPG